MFDTLLNTIIGLTAAAILVVTPLCVYLLVKLVTRHEAATDIQYEDGE